MGCSGGVEFNLCVARVVSCRAGDSRVIKAGCDDVIGVRSSGRVGLRGLISNRKLKTYF